MASDQRLQSLGDRCDVSCRATSDSTKTPRPLRDMSSVCCATVLAEVTRKNHTNALSRAIARSRRNPLRADCFNAVSESADREAGSMIA